jgi:hypothetical protein
MEQVHRFTAAEIREEALFFFNLRPSNIPLQDIEALVRFAHMHPERTHPPIKMRRSEQFGLWAFSLIHKTKTALGISTA